MCVCVCVCVCMCVCVCVFHVYLFSTALRREGGSGSLLKGLGVFGGRGTHRSLAGSSQMGQSDGGLAAAAPRSAAAAGDDDDDDAMVPGWLPALLSCVHVRVSRTAARYDRRSILLLGYARPSATGYPKADSQDASCRPPDAAAAISSLWRV